MRRPGSPNLAVTRGVEGQDCLCPRHGGQEAPSPPSLEMKRSGSSTPAFIKVWGSRRDEEFGKPNPIQPMCVPRRYKRQVSDGSPPTVWGRLSQMDVLNELMPDDIRGMMD
ncbi:hypothetical protein BHE74_00005696 [Ensete ventricosum]|nr:hypothetical protein GW17_00009141 [Ensete ventricosum]RWW85597.1 hypothetical protein BHE74_00005696 [Ensete ventricosum]RZR99500.1 hypothetical protein BHM03_00029055 [Ensete ventricosum]